MTKKVSGVRCQVSGQMLARRYRSARSYLTPDTRRLAVGESLRDSHGIAGLSIGECVAPRQLKTAASHPRLGETRPRAAVTLIELLIVMLIISILAGLILGVAAVAGETARESQSKHTVLRLHKLLAEHYDTYKTRRVDLRKRQGTVPGIKELTEFAIKDTVPNYGAKRREAQAEARLYALRELMLMEIPDRWSDVLLASVVQGTNNANTTPLFPIYLDASGSPTNGRTALAGAYLRRYLALAAGVNSITDSQQRQRALGALLENQGAECLYMVVTLACGDGEARSQFGEDSIGDTDGDGAPEFLDGWGRPIQFLRWAPGFDSQVQINANMLDNPPTGTREQAWAAAASGDHDPFDVYRRDDPAFRLVPLIYSLGRDESAGLHTAPGYVTWRQGIPRIEKNKPYWSVPLTPYVKVVDDDLGIQSYLGTAIPDAGATDNIHNHLLGRR